MRQNADSAAPVGPPAVRPRLTSHTQRASWPDPTSIRSKKPSRISVSCGPKRAEEAPRSGQSRRGHPGGISGATAPHLAGSGWVTPGFWLSRGL